MVAELRGKSAPPARTLAPSLPSACWNQAELYLRGMMETTNCVQSMKKFRDSTISDRKRLFPFRTTVSDIGVGFFKTSRAIPSFFFPSRCYAACGCPSSLSSLKPCSVSRQPPLSQAGGPPTHPRHRLPSLAPRPPSSGHSRRGRGAGSRWGKKRRGKGPLRRVAARGRVSLAAPQPEGREGSPVTHAVAGTPRAPRACRRGRGGRRGTPTLAWRRSAPQPPPPPRPTLGAVPAETPPPQPPGAHWRVLHPVSTRGSVSRCWAAAAAIL